MKMDCFNDFIRKLLCLFSECHYSEQEYLTKMTRKISINNKVFNVDQVC